MREYVDGSDSLEERIAQDDIINRVELWLVQNVPVNEEEHGEIDLFASADLLLFEAEAFDLGEEWRDLMCQLGSGRGSWVATRIEVAATGRLGG
jgi:hypothetical protein